MKTEEESREMNEEGWGGFFWRWGGEGNNLFILLLKEKEFDGLQGLVAQR